MQLRGKLGDNATRIAVTSAEPIKYVYPQMLTLQSTAALERPPLRARVARAVRGRLRLLVDGRDVWSRRIHALPERRIVIPADRLPNSGFSTVHVDLQES